MATAIPRPRGRDLHRDLIVGKGFCRRAGGRSSADSLDDLFGNHDTEVLAVADAVMGWEGKREE